MSAPATRSLRWLSLLLAIVVFCFGCTRAAAASLLPSLQVGLAAQRVRSADAANLATTAKEQWGAALLLTLRFQPQVRAAQLPQRPELDTELWLAPCDVDDVGCLQDTIHADPEVAEAVGAQQ